MTTCKFQGEARRYKGSVGLGLDCSIDLALSSQLVINIPRYRAVSGVTEFGLCDE
jgi:hypothetical protein